MTFKWISLYLRYAVSVHKHALETVVDADVIQDSHGYLTVVLIACITTKKKEIPVKIVLQLA